MTQFHEGQDVEVLRMTSVGRNGKTFAWRTAKIIRLVKPSDPPAYRVQFPDGSRGAFEEEQIRALDPIDAMERLPVAASTNRPPKA
jgi:hypothetical protein